MREGEGHSFVQCGRTSSSLVLALVLYICSALFTSHGCLCFCEPQRELDVPDKLLKQEREEPRTGGTKEGQMFQCRKLSKSCLLSGLEVGGVVCVVFVRRC